MLNATHAFQELRDAVRDLCAQFPGEYFRRIDWGRDRERIAPLYCGGATRRDSVFNGLVAASSLPSGPSMKKCGEVTNGR